MFETSHLLIVGSAFLVAGTIKGVVGFGLPTVSLGLLALVMPLPEAIALPIIPAIITNIWQASAGGNGRAILGRCWPFFLMAAVMVGVGASALTRVDDNLLSALLGLLLVIYAVVNIGRVRFSVGKRHEMWLGPLAGTFNGVFAGMTGSAVVPGVMYLQAIGLPKDALVQAMGMLFTVSTVALAVALRRNQLFTVDQALLSALTLLPTTIGMVAGQSVRKRLSEAVFRKVFFISLIGLGGYIIVTSLYKIL